MNDAARNEAILTDVRANSMDVTRAYMMSCIDQYGKELDLNLSDEEVIDLSGLLYDV